MKIILEVDVEPLSETELDQALRDLGYDPKDPDLNRKLAKEAGEEEDATLTPAEFFAFDEDDMLFELPSMLRGFFEEKENQAELWAGSNLFAKITNVRRLV